MAADEGPQVEPALFQLLVSSRVQAEWGGLCTFSLSPVVLETRARKPTAWDPHTSRPAASDTRGTPSPPSLFEGTRALAEG